MSALITGGLSDFSVKLAESLLEKKRPVILLHNNSNDLIPERLLKNTALTLVTLSSINEDGIKNLIEKNNVGLVFDASLTTSEVLLAPIQAAKSLLLGITAVLDAIRKSSPMPSFVLVSGEHVYGNSPFRVETQPLEPVTFVGSSQMSVEAMVHSYAVSYRIPIVIGRLPSIVASSQTQLAEKLKNEKPDDFVNILSLADSVNGVLSIAQLVDGQKAAEVFNIANSTEFKAGNLTETRKAILSSEKILKSTQWTPSELSSLDKIGSSESAKVIPVFLVYGENSTAKTQFLELAKLEGLNIRESTISNFQEASDKSVWDEVKTVNPSHLVYFSNETDAFEGDCFTLRTNMATNLYFPWLLASVAEKTGIHFTHFGDNVASQDTSALAVKGFTGKMLSYFENTLRLEQKVDKTVLELIKDRKTGGLNNNI